MHTNPLAGRSPARLLRRAGALVAGAALAALLLPAPAMAQLGGALRPERVIRDLGREALSQNRRSAAPTAAPGRQRSLMQIANGQMREFPYVGLPPEYHNRGRSEDKKDLARFPFFDGRQSHWVEGRFYGTPFTPIPGKSMSGYEVERYFADMVADMGGQKIWTGKIPAREIHYWGDEIARGWHGRGDIYNRPVTIYRIPHAGGDLWIQLVTNSAQGWYLVGQGREVTRD